MRWGTSVGIRRGVSPRHNSAVTASAARAYQERMLCAGWREPIQEPNRPNSAMWTATRR